MHFNASYPGAVARKGRATPSSKGEEEAAVAAAGAVAVNAPAGGRGVFACVRDGVGGGMSPRLSVSPRSRSEGLEERTSVVILTRDR